MNPTQMNNNHDPHNFEISQFQNLINEEFYTNLQERRHFCFKLENGATYISFVYFNLSVENKKNSRVFIYCNSEELIVSTKDKTCQNAKKSIDNKKNPHLQLIDFFNTLIEDDFEVLEGLEDEITKIEDDILIGKTSQYPSIEKIVNLRRLLINFKQYYDQLQMIVSTLIENEDSHTTHSLNKKYLQISKRLQQLSSFVQSLRESASQAKESYQSQIDIEQNKLMKIFTVITTIFTPLTLIVGWYGMNFSNMPELHWKYGYIFVIVLSIFICLISMLIFTKKRWFK